MKNTTLVLAALLCISSSVASAQAFDDVIVFVGEKIDVSPFEPDVEPDEILIDAAFKARYKVLEVVAGSLGQDLVEFEVYDHYGTPRFSGYEHALLFLGRSGDKYYHLKYQFFPVYRTTSGGWASCGSPSLWDSAAKTTDIEAHPVAFSPEISFDLSDLNRKEIRETYPKDSYIRKDGRAYCFKGNTPTELMQIKMTGQLKELDWSNVWLRFLL